MHGPYPVAGRFGRRGEHYLLLTAVALVLFFWNLGAATLWDIDEGRNSVCAREMFLAGEWIVPTFNFALRPDKPALLYWLQIIGYRLFGVNEWAARLPSALAALGTLFLVYELARRMFSKSTALLAGIVLATMPMFVAASRFANPDALLAAFSTLTLYFFWRCQERPSAWMFWLTGVASGLAMLAKGPVGLVLPGAVIFLFLAWEGRLGLFFDRRIGWTIAAFVLVALPWYLMVGVLTHWEWPKQFFWGHNVSRFQGTMEGHAGSLVYYPIVLVAGTMPWSILVLATIWMTYWSCLRLRTEPVRSSCPRMPAEAVRASSWLSSMRTHSRRIFDRLRWGSQWAMWAATYPIHGIDCFWWSRLRPGTPGNATWRRLSDPAGRGSTAAYRFLVVWALAYLAFFSLSATKLPNYVLPMTMPIAILTARLVDRWRRGLIDVPGWYRALCLAALAMIGVGFGAGLAIAGGLLPVVSLPSRALPALAPFAWIGLVPIVAAVVLMRLTRVGWRNAATIGFALQAVLFLAPLAAWMTQALNEYKSPAPLVAESGLGRRDVDLRVGIYATERIPSLNFYTGRDIIPIADAAGLVKFMQQPILGYVVVSEADLAAFRRSHKDLDVGHETARHFDMFGRQAMVVLSNE